MRRVQSNTLDVGIDVHLKNWSTAILSKHSVLRRFLQVDCEGPTLISYIVAKHLAHASRHCPQFCVNRKLQDSVFILESCFQI